MASSSSPSEKNGGVVQHLVADSAAFLKCAPLQDMGKNIYTIDEVVSEIRDKATRQRLAVLPYELKFREPSAESIKTMSTFARKVGDYRSLSAVDIKVLALTYQLHKEFCGVDNLKLEPSVKNKACKPTSWHKLISACFQLDDTDMIQLDINLFHIWKHVYQTASS